MLRFKESDRFRFGAAAFVFFAGLLTISATSIRAGRTILIILPIGYFAFLVLLESVSVELMARCRQVKKIVWGLSFAIVMALLCFRWVYTFDALTYSNVGSGLQRYFNREFPEYGPNPYIEGFYFHNFRYAFLANAGQNDLKPGWRKNVSILVYELEPSDKRGQEFIQTCLTKREGRIVSLDWNEFSEFEWAVEYQFGRRRSSPFVVCIKRP